MGDANMYTDAMREQTSTQAQASAPSTTSRSLQKSSIKPAAEKNEELIASVRTYNHIPWCESYEQMISGMLFDPWHPILNDARHKARVWCRQYNSDSSELSLATDLLAANAKRLTMLTDILGRVGDNAWIEPPFNFDYGCNISVGHTFYANFNLTILDSGLVTFGDRVMVGPNVSIYSVNHPTEIRGRRANYEIAKAITVGDDSWIGGNVVILSGVRIGKGCTIGAGSVVTRDIPDWCVAVGNPARVIKSVEPVDDADDAQNM